MNNRDYTIGIILKVRDEIAVGLAKAEAELAAFRKSANSIGLGNATKEADEFVKKIKGDVSKSLESVRRQMGETGRDSDRLANKFESLLKRADENNKAMADTGARLDSLEKSYRSSARAVDKHRTELDKLSATEQKRKSGTIDSLLAEKRHTEAVQDATQKLSKAEFKMNEYRDRLEKAKSATKDLDSITKETIRTQEDHSRTLERTRAAYDKQIDSAAKLKVARDKLAMRPDSERVDFKSIDREIDEERRKASELGAEVEALSKLHPTINIDLDTGHFKEEAVKLEAEKAAVGSDIHVNVDMDLGGAEAKLIAFDAMKNKATGPPRGGQTSLKGWFRDLGQEAEENTHSIAAFDNSLRGLATLIVVTMSQQLLTIMTALGGEIIAVASSAIMAGSAIGGALTAGIAQALPAVGLLVAAFARVGSVISAIKQTETLKQQESYSGEKQEGQQLSSEEGVVNATEAVTAAKQNLRLAEIGLTKARFEARRELQDLIIAEKQAELAAKGAALSQFQAQMTLKEAIRSGNISEVTGAQLEVASSKLSSRQANLNAGRARQDLSLQERGSPLSPDQGVPDAERSIEQSVKALKQSERAAISAKRSAAEAGDQGIAAAGKLNYMLSELDASEKRLYNGARRLYRVYKEVMRPITDIILNSFTYATNKGVELLENPQFQSAFEDLAHSIGDNFKRITDEFNSPQWINFFSTMTKDAGESLGPLTTAFMSMARAFRSIAEAASPVLHDIVGWLAEGAHEFEQWVGKGKGLQDFFKEGEHALEAWLQLTGAILKLFLALIGTSAKDGTSQVESLTDRINEATDYIEHHRKRVEAFFHQVGEVMSVLGDVLIALGAEILKGFNVDSVKDLGDVIIKVVIPALGEAIRMFGKIGSVLAEIANNPAGEFMLKFIGSILILKAVLSPFISVLKGAVIQISKVAQMATGLVLAMTGVKAETIAAHGAFDVLKARLAGYSAESINAASASIASGEAIGSLGGVLDATAVAGAGVSASMFAIPLAIAAVIAAFIYLSAQFGVLDDEWEAIKESGEGFVEPIIGPLEDLIKQVEELLKALGLLGGGATGLGKIFEFVFIKIVKAEIIPMIKFFGSQLAMVGELIGGFFTGISGVIEIITGILTLNFDKIGDGAKKLLIAFTTPFRSMFNQAKRIVSIGVEVITELFGGVFRWLIRKASGIPGSISDSFNAVVRFLSKLGPRVLHAITSGFGAVWGWLKDLPDKMENFARKAVSAVVGVFESMGKKILNAIGSIAGDLVNAGKKIGKELAKGLHQAIKDTPILGKALELGEGAIGLAGKGLGYINPFADGGPVGRGVGSQDDQLGLLTRGEHVLTTDDVKNAGGHEAIFAWRRSLGGRGGQGSGGRFAQGGKVKSGEQQSFNGVNLETLLSMILVFGGESAEAWNGIWNGIQKRTSIGVHFIENRFGDMEQSLIQSSKRINKQVVKSFDSMFGDVRGDVNQLTEVVYQGLSYIAEITEKALQGFGVKKIDLSISKPKGVGKGKATGGFVGNQGERGADKEPTWLGRGEAVLQWGHQKVVDGALRVAHGFGLNDLFDRNHGEHASGGFPGFAKGRPGMSTADLFDGHPSNVASSLRKLIEIIKSKFPALGVSSTTDHSLMTTSGNISDHTTGHAVDLSASIPYMLKAAGWVKSSGLFKQLKQGIHNPNLAVNDGEFVDGPGFFQGAWSEHIDHIHLAVFDALKGAFGGALSKVPKIKLNGTDGVLKDFAQSAIEKVRKAANKMLGKKTSSNLGIHGFSSKSSAGEMSEAEFIQIARKALEITGHKSVPGGARMLLWLAQKESGLNPNSINNWDSNAAAGIPSQGLMELIPPTFESYHQPGTSRNIKDPLANIAASINYQFAKYGHLVHMSPYAAGGVVSGKGGDGSPMPILAHLGEWILNPRQQMRMAHMMGTTVDKLKGMLGFSGGPTSFAGGGEPSVGIGGAKQASLRDSVVKGTFVEELSAEVQELVAKSELVIASITSHIKRISVQLNKFGRVIGRGAQPEKIAEAELRLLNKSLIDLLGEKGLISKQIRDVANELGRARTYRRQDVKKATEELRKAEEDGNKKKIAAAEKELEEIKKSGKETERNIHQGLTSLRRSKKSKQNEIAEKQAEILEKREAVETEVVAYLNERAERKTRGLTTTASIQSAFGFSEAANATTATQVPIWQEQKAALQSALSRAQAHNNAALASQIEGEIQGLEVSIAEATMAMFQAGIEAVEKRFARASALRGAEEVVNNARQAIIGNSVLAAQSRTSFLAREGSEEAAQLGETQRLLAEAIGKSFGPDVTEPLEEKIWQLTGALEENQAAQFENTIAIREAQLGQITGKGSFNTGIYSTLEQIITGLGSLSGVVNQGKLIELIMQAGQSLGATGWELRGQLGRFNEQTIGSGEISGLLGLKGEDLVNAIQHLNFSQIEATLGNEKLIDEFRNLINAMLENEVAIIGNTKQLEEAMQENQIQSFTSTAWQWFRSAIFNGMGGLMPQYAEGTPFYEAASGGEMGSDGTIKAHRGELIIPNHYSSILRGMARAGNIAAMMSGGSIPGVPLGASLAGAMASGNESTMGMMPLGGSAAEIAALRMELARRTQEINVEVNEADPTDPTYLASRLAFAVKNPAV